MAASVEEADTSSLCVTVPLTEDDIPGAALTEPFENHCVTTEVVAPLSRDRCSHFLEETTDYSKVCAYSK